MTERCNLLLSIYRLITPVRNVCMYVFIYLTNEIIMSPPDAWVAFLAFLNNKNIISDFKIFIEAS